MALNQTGAAAADPLEPLEEPEIDLLTLTSAERRSLVIRAGWSDLRLRLRAHALKLRSENTHLITFLTESDADGAGHLDIDDICTILSTLEFPFLPPSAVQDLFEAHESLVEATLFEDRTVILKRFGDFRGNVDYRRFYDALGLDPPKDYLDPDQFMDPLPQPYRLINKTLMSIFDDTWDLICSRHPALKELPVPNPELYGLGEKRKVVEIREAKISSPSGVLENYGTLTCAEWSLGGNMLGCGTASGHFVLLNPKSSAPVDGPSNFLGNSGFNLGASAAMASSCILGNCAVFTDIPYGVSHVSVPARPKGGQLRCVRVALSAPFALPADSFEDTEDLKAKKGKKGKKEEVPEDEEEGRPPPPTPMVSKLAVVECWQTLGGEGGKVRIDDRKETRQFIPNKH